MYPDSVNLFCLITQRVVFPPLFGLPVELWGEIFENSLPDHPFITPSPASSPLLVSQICRDWRNIALSTPSVWARLNASVSDYTPISLVDLWLSRSASFPLSLHISWSRDISSGVSEAFFTLFVSHLSHWRSLEFHVDPNNSFFPDIPPEGAPMLEEVILLRGGNHHRLFRWFCSVMHTAPLLKTVREQIGAQLHLPWAQLSHIGMHVYSLEEALDILAHASKLVECTFTFERAPSQESIHTPHITLHHLNHLSIDAKLRTEVSLTTFFSHLTLPALESFTGSGCFDNSFLSLLSRSHTCSLSSLRLSNTQISDSLLIECLRHPCVQSLSHLGISSCPNAVTDNVLKFLTFREEHAYVLPKLEILEFSSCMDSLTVFLTDMMSSRSQSQQLPTGVNPLKYMTIGAYRINF